jgi:hypothetical protein
LYFRRLKLLFPSCAQLHSRRRPYSGNFIEHGELKASRGGNIREGHGMSQAQYQYVLYDNALQGRNAGDLTVDEFADALRAPLAAIGVIVERMNSHGVTIGIGELLGAESLSNEDYRKKYGEVDRAVRRVFRIKPENG